jgi:hypothetical protein
MWLDENLVRPSGSISVDYHEYVLRGDLLGHLNWFGGVAKRAVASCLIGLRDPMRVNSGRNG